MKYCVSSRQPYSVMKEADEIFVQYQDRGQILDFVEKIPTKTIILDYPTELEFSEWNTWSMYQEKLDNFYIALHNLSFAEDFNTHGVKWYWPYPITSFYELNSIVAAGAAYVLLGPPLTHSVDKIRRMTGARVRAVANSAKPKYLHNANSIVGSWIRPEDVKEYEQYIDCLEFESNSLKEEAALLHIYKDNQEWPGNLNLIIHDLGVNVDNRGIVEPFGAIRATCGQRCQSGSVCRYCERAIDLSNLVKKSAHKN